MSSEEVSSLFEFIEIEISLQLRRLIQKEFNSSSRKFESYLWRNRFSKNKVWTSSLYGSEKTEIRLALSEQKRMLRSHEADEDIAI